MSEPEYASFDEAEVSSALEAARQEYEGVDFRSVTEVSTAVSPNLELRATCLELRSTGRRVCLELPLNLGRRCVPVNLPDGTLVRVCLSICTTFGVPTGVCVRVFLGSEQVAKRCFGFGC